MKLGTPKKFKLGPGGLLILPCAVLFYAMLIVPFALMIYLSVINWTPMMGNFWEAAFFGGMNYLRMLTDTRFIDAMLRTLFFVGVCGSLELLLGLGMALFLLRTVRLRKIFVPLWIVPMMLVPAVVGYTFYLLFMEGGMVTQLLAAILGPEFKVRWLSDPTLAYIPIILGEVWQWTPFMFLVLFSGLVALPEEPFRAARVLGASETHIFRRLTLPMLKPVILIAVLIRTLELFKFFDIPFIMTKGGPGLATETMSIYMFYHGFVFWRLAYVAAGSIVIMVLILIVIIFAGKPLYRIK